ncbi:glycosyltransferase family 4 protein [Candidatus Puniceispirillum sp.]|uniref:glycosyltransferase family 4 protein n=1 Tax=Candidatus Puniceispirillum sp. TaxID=2026719 RepID=UPI003F69D664
MSKKRVLFVISEDWAFISHRLHLADAAIKAGYEVGLLTRVTIYGDMLEARGIKLFHWDLNRSSLNIFGELGTVWQAAKLFRYWQPDLIHAVAQKPILYAGIAGKFAYHCPRVSAMGGVGFIFSSGSMKARLLRPLISRLLGWVINGKKTRFILQNDDDIALLTKLGVARSKTVRLIKGSGVEIEDFVPSPLPNKTPMVILPARLLWDKGIAEFVRVAKRIKAKDINCRFVLVGDPDPKNAASIKEHQVQEWVDSGAVERWGRRDDMPDIYPQSSIVCLPSYREGLPKVLLEGASCARPVVAFDVPGCREIVREGINGFLVPFGDETALELALIKLLQDTKLCAKLGKAGRKIVEAEFSQSIIAAETFAVWDEVL